MKKILTVIFILFSYSLFAFDPPKVGDPIPDFDLLLYKNSPEKFIHSRNLQNKIYILDFWATWCGPCIPAMDHFNNLQNKFPDQLQVIAISSESHERLNLYPAEDYQSIWFSTDLNDKVHKIFDVTIIPHAVIVDKEGKIAAITTPERITEKIIEQLIRNQKIDLPEKVDSREIDYAVDYFNADPNTAFSINLRTYRQGYPTYKGTKDPFFQDRRLTCINFTIAGLYQTAFQTTTARIEYKADKRQFIYKKENLYCFDIIVPEERTEELHGIMQQYLNSILPVHATIEKKEKEVYILKRLNTFQENTFLAKDTIALLAFNAPDFEMRSSSMEVFCQYLENNSTLPIVDETSLSKIYDISFSHQLSNPTSLFTELRKLGLTLEKGKREIDVLVIYD